MTSPSVQILVVDDDPAIGDLLTVLLSEEGYAVVSAGSAERALALAEQVKYAAAIVDVNLPAMDGYALVRRLRKRPNARDIPILMLTSRGDIADKVAGFEAGADDYIIKPFQPTELSYRLKALLARTAPLPQPAVLRRGHVTAVFAAKGGVGKTTIAVNLALALQSKRKASVALFDADLYFGDVGLQLNLPPLRSILNLAIKLENIDSDLVGQVLARHETGIRVLPSPFERAKADLVTSEHLGKILAVLAGMQDHVIVDCHSAYDDRTLVILEHADTILLVVTPEVASLVNSGAFFEIAAGLGIHIDAIRVVLNRCNSEVGISQSDVERSLHHRIDFSLISGGRPIIQYANRGVPIVIGQPNHLFSKQILQIADYIDKVTAPQNSPP